MICDLENCRVCGYPATPERDERGIRYDHAGRLFPCRWESIDALVPVAELESRR